MADQWDELERVAKTERSEDAIWMRAADLLALLAAAREVARVTNALNVVVQERDAATQRAEAAEAKAGRLREALRGLIAWAESDAYTEDGCAAWDAARAAMGEG